LIRYFARRLRAIRELRQQAMAVVVEIADQRHVAAHRVEPRADFRDLARRLGSVDGDAHQLRARAPRSNTWRAVDSASAVSVFVIDCTTIGAPPPTATSPTRT
jgi:hypothetical protein